MPSINPDFLISIAEKFHSMQIEFVFIGGAVVEFLLDNPKLVQLRVTDDVDAVVNILSFTEYANLETKLRQNGFKNDVSENPPTCRWIFDGRKIDIIFSATTSKIL